MKRFLYKTACYGFLVLLFLEVLVRVFHLHRDTPERYIDEKGIEKWVPGQSGFSVTGNRKQNFSAYRINNSGYNSYREFNPEVDKCVIALIGDSFIEGFHQPYNNSIGKKIEELSTGLAVYEYGYAGYDMADQLHLISAYKEQFEEIEKVVIYLKYPEDLYRDRFSISQERLRLNEGIYPILKRSKLLVYAQNIGLIASMRIKVQALINILRSGSQIGSTMEEGGSKKSSDQTFLENFKRLSVEFEYDKSKYVLLLDSRECPELLLRYLAEHQFSYIDYGKIFQESEKPVTLIYDQHWNDHGRQLVSKAIVDKIMNSADD